MRVLPTTTCGALMSKSGHIPAPVISDSRQWRLTGRVADACSSKLKTLHRNPYCSAATGKPVKEENLHGWTTKDINWPVPGKESVARTIILDNTTTAKSITQRWAREKEAQFIAGVWKMWTAGSHSVDSGGGAAAVGKHRNECRSHHSYLGAVRIEVFNTGLWPIELTLEVTHEKRDTLQKLEVKMVAVVSDFQTTIQCAAHLAPGLGQHFSTWINVLAKALHTDCITTENHRVPAHFDIPAHTDDDCLANLAQDPSGVKVKERLYTTA
jgi:hypothetical protein